MNSNAHAETLFHLVPTNQLAHDALQHPDNKRFVSKSADGRPGLEIGFHVPSTASGHVIARLGRNADLILHKGTRQHPMSAIHVAFEINPSTALVLLSVRSKRLSSVEFKVLLRGGEKRASTPAVPTEKITGDGVILYGQDYSVKIASYEFDLVWRQLSTDLGFNPDALKRFTIQGYQTSLRRLKDVRSRDRPTGYDELSEAVSWHVTRLHTTRGPRVKEFRGSRHLVGRGAFGTVYGAVDQVSGHRFAVKVVHLKRNGECNVDAARAFLHREIKVMARLNHPHIIEYLGHQLFHTLSPEIFMPLREGSLALLARTPRLPADHGTLCTTVMEQMLSALDYLASENLIHRDLKPDNILYSSLGENRYLFQLADFGLAHHRSLAKTLCGTGYFQAPELWPGLTGIRADQSPKLDVWSLFATIIAVYTRFEKFPPNTSDYAVVLSTLKAQALQSPRIEPMTRLHPDRRASAAQMLVLLFDAPQKKRSPATVPGSQPKTGSDCKAPQPPIALIRPLIVYQRRHVPPSATLGNLPPKRARENGVVKRRAELRTAKAHNLATSISLERQPPGPARLPSKQKLPATEEAHETRAFH